MVNPGHTVAPSLGDIEALAERALATLPAAFTRHLGRVVIRVEDFPDAETEEEMELESPFDILGLYRGVALPRRTDAAHGQSGRGATPNERGGGGAGSRVAVREWTGGMGGRTDRPAGAMEELAGPGSGGTPVRAGSANRGFADGRSRPSA